MRFTKNGMRDMAEDVAYLANREGLTGHAASIETRAADSGCASQHANSGFAHGSAAIAALSAVVCVEPQIRFTAVVGIVIAVGLGRNARLTCQLALTSDT